MYTCLFYSLCSALTPLSLLSGTPLLLLRGGQQLDEAASPPSLSLSLLPLNLNSLPLTLSHPTIMLLAKLKSTFNDRRRAFSRGELLIASL